jgi:ribosome-binding protein aMBF1 (putative translation factor)
MITGTQIRSARAGLGWNIIRLSKETQVRERTIIRMEATDGLPNSTAANIKIIRLTLEAAGIEFIGTPDDRPGIRINIK